MSREVGGWQLSSGQLTRPKQPPSHLSGPSPRYSSTCYREISLKFKFICITTLLKTPKIASLSYRLQPHTRAPFLLLSKLHKRIKTLERDPVCPSSFKPCLRCGQTPRFSICWGFCLVLEGVVQVQGLFLYLFLKIYLF